MDVARVSIEELNLDELKFAISKEEALIRRLGEKLPDHGAKLNIYRNKLLDEVKRRYSQSEERGQPLIEDVNILTSKNVNIEPDQNFITPISSYIRNDFRTRPDDLDYSEYANTGETTDASPTVPEDGTENLAEIFSTLDVNSETIVPNPIVQEDEEKEECLELPRLTSNQLVALSRVLGLPTPILSNLSYFTFAIRPLHGLLYLVAVDCNSPSRHFVRIGLQHTWSLQLQPRKTDYPVSTDVVLSSPGQAVHDLWEFVSKVTSNRDSIPCFICCSVEEDGSDQSVDLLWFSRLIRATRHSSIARIGVPCDSRFVCLSPSKTQDPRLCNDLFLDLRQNCLPSISAEVSSSSYSEQLLERCRLSSAHLFDRNESGLLQLRYFTDFHHMCCSTVTRTMPWMEAPIELHFLRQLKLHNDLISDTGSVPGLQDIPDSVLRRLAAVGLGRTRLAYLVGLGGWESFAGVLSYQQQSSIDNKSSEIIDSSGALITGDVQIIRQLYLFFKHVHRHLIRHSRYYDEGSNLDGSVINFLSTIPDVPRSLPKSLTCADKIRAWTSAVGECDRRSHLTARIGSIPKQSVYRGRTIKLLDTAYGSFPESCQKKNQSLLHPVTLGGSQPSRTVVAPKKKKPSSESSSDSDSTLGSVDHLDA